jgi:hypothetical protein
MAGKSTARPMSKAQICTHLATKFEITKKSSAEFLEEIAKLAYREAKKETFSKCSILYNNDNML